LLRNVLALFAAYFLGINPPDNGFIVNALGNIVDRFHGRKHRVVEKDIRTAAGLQQFKDDCYEAYGYLKKKV
jgi:hypothetical protein